MLRVGDELIVGPVIEAEKRTDVRSKNLCKSKNIIRFCNIGDKIIVIFLEVLRGCCSLSVEKNSKILI